MHRQDPHGIARDGRDDSPSPASDHEILEGAAPADPGLAQVREILFGAEARRAEAARRALEERLAERFAQIEAAIDQRSERLAQELKRSADRHSAQLEAETAERREALRLQAERWAAQLGEATAKLEAVKTDREELAQLLDQVASRLRDRRS